MKKITKKPKEIEMVYQEILSYRSEYFCPTCGTKFIGGITKNTTQFKCTCGQELKIVEVIEKSRSKEYSYQVFKEAVDSMTDQQKWEAVVKAGIANEDGTFTKEYGGLTQVK